MEKLDLSYLLPHATGLSAPTRVGAFLLKSLGELTQERYARALLEFVSELHAAGVVWLDLDEVSQDWQLAEFILDGYDSGESRSKFAYLLSALGRINPRARYRTAWKTLDVWTQLVPAHQAPALPLEYILAMATLLVTIGREAEGMAVMLCVVGLLRANECLSLTLDDVIVSDSCVILLLGKTKRGTEQRVIITNALVLSWLCHFVEWKKLHGHNNGLKANLFIGCSYGRFLYWSRKSAAALGLADVSVTTHSFRRSGATALALLGYTFEDIMLFGRWASNRSAREYIRKGEQAVLRTRSACLKERWRAVLCWGGFANSVWQLRHIVPTFRLAHLDETITKTLQSLIASAQ
jgi:integrase